MKYVKNQRIIFNGNGGGVHGAQESKAIVIKDGDVSGEYPGHVFVKARLYFDRPRWIAKMNVKSGKSGRIKISKLNDEKFIIKDRYYLGLLRGVFSMGGMVYYITTAQRKEREGNSILQVVRVICSNEEKIKTVRELFEYLERTFKITYHTYKQDKSCVFCVSGCSVFLKFCAVFYQNDVKKNEAYAAYKDITDALLIKKRIKAYEQSDVNPLGEDMQKESEQHLKEVREEASKILTKEGYTPEMIAKQIGD